MTRKQRRLTLIGLAGLVLAIADNLTKDDLVLRYLHREGVVGRDLAHRRHGDVDVVGLQNAAEVAILLLTTDCIVAETRK